MKKKDNGSVSIELPTGNTFPVVRLRRLRRTPAIRDLLQEIRVSPKDLVCPVFIEESAKKSKVIPSMPDIKRIPLDGLITEVDAIVDSGIKAVLLFGIPSNKNDKASSAHHDAGIVQRSVQLIRSNFGDKVVICTDVCLCQYTSHGHCGIMNGNKIDNDSSIGVLSKVAVSHARAGADIVAPSAMMDGQVKAIRSGLDNAGLGDVAIMGYSAKHASPLYSPFRDAAHSTPEFGDRKSYQMPFSNAHEAMQEIEQDVKEGADIIMIKPAIPYLDIISRAREMTNLPICAYSVSGEYALIKSAAMEGWLDEDSVMVEFITAIKRAGADFIITYHAKRMAQFLNQL